jgi:5-methylcytosine-specific restriction endonuclease McrA
MKRTRIMPYVLRKVEQNNIKKYGSLTCEICGGSIEHIFQYDHVIPVSKFNRDISNGRMNSIKNLQITHKECNKEKSNKINV